MKVIMPEDAVPNLLAEEYSAISLITAELKKIGYTHEYFWVGDESYSRFQHTNSRTWVTRNASISYPMTNPAISHLCKHKNLTYEYVSNNGITVPVTLQRGGDKDSGATDMNDLLDRFKKLVIKPVDSLSSKGLTIGVTDSVSLNIAIDYALEYSDTALVQQQIEGDEVRFVLFDGIITAALIRQTPQVVGDGTSSIRELIEQENVSRRLIVDTMVTYPDIDVDQLTGINLSLIPEDGEVIELSRATSIRNGASIYNVIDKVHESYIKLVELLIADLGARFIVVDVMFKDYTMPADDQNYALIEFNELPSLRLCYSSRDGSHYDILSYLIPMIDSTLKH